MAVEAALSSHTVVNIFANTTGSSQRTAHKTAVRGSGAVTYDHNKLMFQFFWQFFSRIMCKTRQIWATMSGFSCTSESGCDSFNIPPSFDSSVAKCETVDRICIFIYLKIIIFIITIITSTNEVLFSLACWVCWFVSRITLKPLNGFPMKLGWRMGLCPD